MRGPHRARRAALCAVVVIGTTSIACTTSPPPATERPRCTVAAIGDSLMVGTLRYLGPELAAEGCGLWWHDARVGRPTSEGVAVLRGNQWRMPDVLLVGLGTNDRYDLHNFARYVDEVMAIARGRVVIWSDIAHLPIRSTLNLVLYLKSITHPNLQILAWDAPYWSTAHWRGRDGVHASDAGYAGRAALTAARVAAVVPEPPRRPTTTTTTSTSTTSTTTSTAPTTTAVP
jgi:hypothetical protein